MDEDARDTADFVTAAGALEDRYGVTDLSTTPANVLAVQMLISARKSDVGACTMRTRLVSGASIANGATVSPNTANAVLTDIIETDPDGGGAWTAARVNAAQIGIQRLT